MTKIHSNIKEHVLSCMNPAEMPFLSLIFEGKKTAEGRINSPVCQKMRPGDRLRLVDRQSGHYVLCAITYLHCYKSFRKMFDAEGLYNMLPFARTVEEGVAAYEAFPGARRVAKMGCVAIGVQPIESNLIV